MSSLRSTVGLGLKPDRRGKVREIFDLGRELFIVATDRHLRLRRRHGPDRAGARRCTVVMTMAWMKFFKEVPNHLWSRPTRPLPRRRSAITARCWPAARCWCARPSPSRWSASRAATSRVRAGAPYQQDGTVCGHVLPPGCGNPTSCRPPVHALDQGGAGPRREHRLRRRLRPGRRGRRGAPARRHARPLPPRRRLRARRRRADRRHQVRVRLVDGALVAHRRGPRRPIPAASGPRPTTGPAEPPSWDKQILRDPPGHPGLEPRSRRRRPCRRRSSSGRPTVPRDVLNILFAEEARRSASGPGLDRPPPRPVERDRQVPPRRAGPRPGRPRLRARGQRRHAAELEAGRARGAAPWSWPPWPRSS